MGKLNAIIDSTYIRYTTTEEKTMLHQMAEDYEVDPVYVLDLYRHSKVNWMLDFVIRTGVGIFLLVVGSVIVRGVKKKGLVMYE